jgi:integrase/recombinase XerD
MVTHRTGLDLAEAAEDWLATKRIGALADDRGHSDRARRNDLRRWAGAILEVVGKLPDPAPTDLSILSFVTVMELGSLEVLLRALDLLGSSLAPTSRARMLITLRTFSDWLFRRGLLAENVTDELRVKVIERTEVEAFTPEHIARMLTEAAIASPQHRSAWPTRDVAIIATVAGCGLRVSELCALSFADLDRRGTHPLFRIRKGSKGGKQRIVPIPIATLDFVDAYLQERFALTVGPRKPIFVRHNGNALNQQFVYAMLERVVIAAGVPLPNGAMTHALRHSYGTQLALRGLPLPVLQQLMGHSDPRTTTGYTRAQATELTTALNQTGWLNN